MAKETKQPQLTEEQIKAVDSYGDRIVTLKDTVTAIRKLPGMYCAGYGNPGFLSLCREVFQNAADQIVEPNSPANRIVVTYDERTLEFSCTDNGLGFPYDDMVRMVTAQHTSKNFVKTKGSGYPSGMHGSGLKVVNALSSFCRIESYRYDGSAKAIDLIEGYLDKGPYDIPNKDHFQGSKVTFTPSISVMKEINLGWESLYVLFKRILSLLPIGSEVDFLAIDTNGIEHNEHMINRDGIITELINAVKYPFCKPIVIHHDDGEHSIDVAFTYDAGPKDVGPDPNEHVTSFCNMCPTISGHHISATIDGITAWFVDYMNNIYLAGNKKSKITVKPSDIKSGLNVVISGNCLEPVFIGQAKEQLNEPTMAPFARKTMKDGLTEWSKANPGDLSTLCDYFKKIAELRGRSEKEKVKIVQKYESNPLTGFPSNYAKPTKKKSEFIIVEGDSAGGSAKVARDVTCQGIYPIRGKISSPFNKSFKELFSNAEVQGMSNIIMDGKPYRKDFDPVKDVPWEKIIFMADADVDR